MALSYRKAMDALYLACVIIAGVSLVSWLGVLWAGRMLPFLGAGVGAGL